MASSAPIDEVNVNRIKEAIKRGEYPINIDRISEALMDAYREMKS
jgi:negative regulator of flagellin synthesis FlgM